MPYNDLEQITKDDLIADEEFLSDASSFLYNRTGAFLTDPEKIYDAYAKHMRFHNTNEVTVARDLMYAQEASDADKAAFGRLLNSFDKLDTDVSSEWNELLADYGLSIASAPSTWLGAVTAGMGKGAALTGQQAAKLGVRQILNSAMKGAAVESGVAAGQEIGREATRVEAGLQENIRGENVLTVGALGGAFGAAGGAIAGGMAVRNANKALALQQKAEEAVSVRVGKATEEANKTLETKKEAADAVKERLKALDPDMVAEGRALKDEKFTPLEMTMVSLDLNVKKAVIAAATDLVTKADLVDADGNAIRITEAVVNKLRSGALTADIIDEVREKYNLTAEQFGLIFGADLSDYGRGLNLASQLKKNVNKREALETLIDNVSEIANAKTSKGKQLGGVTDAQLEEVHELHKGLGIIADEATGFIKGFERLRRGILTTQPQTTLRNVAGGAFRVLLDAPEYVMQELTKKVYNGLAGRKVYETSPIATIIRNSASIMKYMSPVSVAGGSPQAAEIIAQMYIRSNPDSAQRLFHMFIEGADASYNSKTFNAMSEIGAGLNFMNRYSDDVFKKAIFAGELDRLVMTRYNKSLTDMVAEGKFQDIDPDFFTKAGEKAFELLYQKVPKGKSLAATFARGYLEADKRAISGIALGALIPFPRFVINQIEFMYDHAPILGLMSSKSTPEKMAKQLSGLGMITAAFMFRAEQGKDTEWYTGVNEDGSTVDLRPFLGPLNLHMYMADLFYKHWDSTKNDVENTAILYDKTDMKTVTEIAFGSAFRVGTGAYLINSAVPEFAEAMQSIEGDEQESKIKFQRAWGRLIGDYAATFTYALPIAVARDIYKLTDEELRKIPETNGNVSMMDIIRLRATRTLPGEWRESAIQALGGLEQEPIATERYEITNSEPTRTVDPFGTMVTGLSRQRAPNMLEKELTRLGISAYDLYKPVPLGPADVMIRKQLSGNGEIPSLYNYLKPLIVSSDYKQRSKEEQQYLLQSYGRAYVSDVRNQIYDVLIEKAQAKEIDFTVGQILNFQLESVPALARKSAIKIYEREYGKFDNRNEKQVEMVIDISKVIEKEFEYDEEEKKKYARGGLVTRNYAEGGYVPRDPLTLSETGIEQEDEPKSEYEIAKEKLPIGLRMYVGIEEAKDDLIDYGRGYRSNLAQVQKEFDTGDRNLAEYVVGTGYYGLAKPAEDAFSLFVPDAVEEAISAGAQSFMDYTGLTDVINAIDPDKRRFASELVGIAGFVTPAKAAGRLVTPDAGTARAGREASSGDVLFKNFYQSDVETQTPMVGSEWVRKNLGDTAASLYNKGLGAVDWGSKGGKRVINNMFNPATRALYEEYGISPVFKDVYNTIKKEEKKLEEMKAAGVGSTELGKQQAVITYAVQVAHAQMQQMAHIRQQARAAASVEDIPMRFALASADPNVPEIYFSPKDIGDNWYEKTGAKGATLGVEIPKAHAEYAQKHFENAWKSSGLDMDRVKVIVKTPSAPMTGNHFASLANTAQLNTIERVFRPEKGRGFVDFKRGVEGPVPLVGRLKNAIEEANEKIKKAEESKAEKHKADLFYLQEPSKQLKVLDTDETGVWVTFSHAGRGKVEGGVNVLFHVDFLGNIEGYVSDLHDFLNKAPVLGKALDIALPTQVLGVTPPMQTNVFSISTLRDRSTNEAPLRAEYGESVALRIEDQPDVPEAAKADAARQRIEEAAQIRASAKGIAKETVPVARNITFGANVLGEEEEALQEFARNRGGLMSRRYAEGGFVDDNPMMLSETAAEEDPVARQQAGEKFVSEMTELGLDMAPVTGEIRSAQGAVEDYEAGNYGMAALGALGSIPIVGPAVRGATKGAKKVIDAAETFEKKKIKDTVAKTKEKKKINDELRELSVKGELPEDFAGYKLNDEVDVPGIGTGRIGRVYYNNQGEAMINIATDVEDTPLIGMKVSDAVEQGVGITKPAPVKKVNVNTAKLPQQEFVMSPHNQMMRDTQDSDPETYRKLMEISKDDPEGFVKHIFDYRKDKWLEKTGKTPNTEVVERNNIMQNAANKVKDGELSVEEFRKIADQHKPVKVWDTMPEMATYEDMFFALDAKKRQSPFVGYNATIPDGTRMTSRLDIPAYTNSDTWIVTLKGDYNDGKNMYTPAVRMRNVDLNQSLKNQEKALGVAAGKAKGPFAVMEGDYVEETAEDTYKLAQQALESGDWVQVGYDPTRRGFFYDRKTMEPVLAADEIVQVGPLVLAKNATKGDAKEFKFAKGGLMAKP